MQRHLSAFIGSELDQKEYIEEIVTKWRDEQLLLSKIAEIQHQAAYSAYIHGFKSKYNVFNHTIPTMQNYMKVIEDVLRNHFILAIIAESSVSDHLQQLIALPMGLGGMAITTPHLNTELRHQRCLLKIFWITSLAKAQIISLTNKRSLRLKTVSRREEPKLKIRT